MCCCKPATEAATNSGSVRALRHRLRAKATYTESTLDPNGMESGGVEQAKHGSKDNQQKSGSFDPSTHLNPYSRANQWAVVLEYT